MRTLCMRPGDLAEYDAKRGARGKESPKAKVAWALAVGPERERALAGYRLDETNAVSEGANNAIKALKRVCFGFGKFERMRRRCLLVLGCTRLVGCWGFNVVPLHFPSSSCRTRFSRGA